MYNEDDLKDQIVTWIKACRVRRKWTKEQMAQETGISRDHLHNLEVGKRMPGIEILQKISNATGRIFVIEPQKEAQ